MTQVVFDNNININRKKKAMKKNAVIIMVLMAIFTLMSSTRHSFGQINTTGSRRTHVSIDISAIMPPAPTQPSAARLTKIQGREATLTKSTMDNREDSGSPFTPNIQTLTPPSFVLIDLDIIGKANGVNNKGQIVGTSYVTNSFGEPFLYSNNIVYNIAAVGGLSGEALGINDSCYVVGDEQFTSANPSTAFLYMNGVMQNLGTLDGSRRNSYGNAINGKEKIAGSSGISSGIGQAFLYAGGSFQSLNLVANYSSEAKAINNKDEVVGDFSSFSFYPYTHAFIWFTNNSMIDIGVLMGNGYSRAYGINDSRQVVGACATNGGNNRVFLYSDSSVQYFGGLAGSFDEEAYGVNNNLDIVGSSTASTRTGTIQRATLYLNGQVYDLNSLIVPTNSGFTLVQANAINDKRQIVGYGINSAGKQHAFLLNPIPAGSKEALEVQPSIKTYGVAPTKKVGKDGLIVITHGYQKFPFPTDVSFVDTMSNNISTNLINHGINNWQVYGYKWVNNAWTILPDTALNNANQEGINLGNSIVNQGWTHVHLIAHSAGAGVIDLAAAVIKAFSPSTIVQCTFLDPYDGYYFTGATTYGSSADWSDRYSSSDDYVNLLAPFTDIPLEYAYNVDVTALSPVQNSSTVFYGLPGSPSCVVNSPSHHWAVDFYQNTITGNTTPAYDGFGFPLSMEGGNWAYATNHYHVGNVSSVTNLGVALPSCGLQYTTASTPTPVKKVNFQTDPTIWKSPTGTVIADGESVTEYSGSPAWFGTLVQSTNPFNVVSFDAEFVSSNGAAGLLSLTLDTNMIGSVDERVAIPGWQHYTLSFPVAAANSPHVLGIRLDPFTNIQSVVTLTNIVLSKVGVTQPFSLTVITNSANSLPVYQLTGEPSFDYGLQMSTNLIDWTQIAILENSTGTVNFTDPDSTNSVCRFYRAVAPY